MGKRLEASSSSSSSSIFSSLDPLCSSGLFVSVFGIGAAMFPAKKGRKKKKSIVLNFLEFGAEESSDFEGEGGGGGRRGELVNLLCFIILPLLLITLLCFNVWNCVNFVQLLLLSALDFAVASLRIML